MSFANLPPLCDVQCAKRITIFSEMQRSLSYFCFLIPPNFLLISFNPMICTS